MSKLRATELSLTGRIVILSVAFLGWLFAGVQMSITSLAMRSAAIDLLARGQELERSSYASWNAQWQREQQGAAEAERLEPHELEQLKQWKGLAQRWFAWYQCSFLFGAAAGGLFFGHLGDRLGRSKAMTASILCYSLFSAAAYYSQSTWQLLILRFLACLGVGGMWPNGVALVSEAWSNLSRPMLAGVMGTSANIGIFAFATLARNFEITPDDWRWVMLAGASPVLLGVLSLAAPESPRWLQARRDGRRRDSLTQQSQQPRNQLPPFLALICLGVLLATVPLMGGWGSANWMVPWAGEAGEAADPPNPFLKAQVGQTRALTGIVGSLLGGWIAHRLGRRTSYCLTSLAALFCAQYAFWLTVPTDRSFLLWVAAIGFFSGIYFGWLPLFLPELFPTKVRAVGAGVSFNFGRILTATAVLLTGSLTTVFQGDYARIGRVTSLIFLLGAIIIWWAPDTSRKDLSD